MSKDPLFTKYYKSPAAKEFDKINPVKGSTSFHIESNTRVFVALALLQQEALGHLNLDDSVLLYVPDLAAG